MQYMFFYSTVAQICSLPPETGRCLASMRRFFFNATSRKCEEFMFGGCEGNANRFDTEEECNDYCGGKLNHELSWIETALFRRFNIGKFCNLGVAVIV